MSQIDPILTVTRRRQAPGKRSFDRLQRIGPTR